MIEKESCSGLWKNFAVANADSGEVPEVVGRLSERSRSLMLAECHL
jgi:hypothetical protein